MPYIIVVLLLVGLLYGPQIWARSTFKRHAKPRDDIQGSGGELASHLISRYALKDVQVECTETQGDHYDPVSRTVRLSPDNYNGRSLTAIAIAAHEVGHAIQHFRQERLLSLRSKLIESTAQFQQLAAMFLIVIPVVAAFVRSPILGLVMLLIGISSMGASVVVHLVTLPVEIDASFGKALPILKEGNYIQKKDEAAVRRILKAAAYTYVAASLASLLNLWRWFAVFKR